MDSISGPRGREHYGPRPGPLGRSNLRLASHEVKSNCGEQRLIRDKIEYQSCDGLDQSRSSFNKSVLIANAASAPSAAATTTHCTARDASPATKSPERWVDAYVPVRTVPLSLTSHRRRIANSDRWNWPVEKNIARRASGSPASNTIRS